MSVLKNIVWVTLLLPFIIYAQNSSSFKMEILDGDCYPLQLLDDGIKIQYFTKLGGNFNLYFQLNNEYIAVKENELTWHGTGIIPISTKKILSIYKPNTNIKNGSIRIYHYPLRSDKRYKYNFPIEIFTEAPYGIELYKNPEEPNLYHTDYKINKIKKSSLIGGICGAALFLGSAIQQKKLDDTDSSEYKRTELLASIGGIIFLLSILDPTYDVPDYIRNNKNNQHNQRVLREWEREKRYVKSMNNLVRQTYKIQININKFF